MWMHFQSVWNGHLFYAFLPFSLIARCLQKIELEKPEGIIVVPMWDTQPWYSQLLRMLTDVPRTRHNDRTLCKCPQRGE